MYNSFSSQTVRPSDASPSYEATQSAQQQDRDAAPRTPPSSGQNFQAFNGRQVAPSSNTTVNPASSRSFQPSHGHSQSTSVLLNSSSSSRPMFRPQPQQNPSVSNRSGSMRPMSAFQPLDNPEYYASGGGSSPTATATATATHRPPSPAGSTARSIRSTPQTPLTFKSQDLRSALSLQESQQKKLYMEGYLLKRDDLGTDGKPLHVADEKRRWSECFVQLSGTVLSLWNVDQMQEAAKRGSEVPPTYINITDSFVDFIGLLIEDPKLIPASRGRYHHAFAINSAGNNRTIFCFRDPPPFPPESLEQWLAPEHRHKPEHRTVIGWLNLGHRHLQAWINAIRLASWEKVRLEEIYTGALIRARLGAVGSPGSANPDTVKDASAASAAEMSIKSPLVKGKMEGWVKARFMGSTEWKKVWMVLTDHKPDESEFGAKKKFWKIGSSTGDRSSILSVNSVSTSAPGAPTNDGKDLPPPPGSNGAPGVASFFESKKDKKPFASLIYAAHAFAVYPSRPELVEGSSLFKVEGVFPSSSVLSATHRVRSTGWVMLMPELETPSSKGANAEMMKWLIAFMDSFKLYGRPETFVWEARDPTSPFFAYPIGPFKDRLFLDRELAEFLEIAREDHLTTRSSLHGIMAARMRGERTKILQPLPPPSQNALASTQDALSRDADEPRTSSRASAAESASQLPPLDFASNQGQPPATGASMAQSGSDQIDRVSQAFRDPARADAADAESTKGASPESESIRPSRDAVAVPSGSLQPTMQDAAPTQTAQAPASTKSVPVVTAPVSNTVTASNPAPAPAIVAKQSSTTPYSRDQQGESSSLQALASPSTSAPPPMHGVPPVQQTVPATESSLAYLAPSDKSQAMSPSSETSATRPPAVFGPSGRGAEQNIVDQPRSTKRDSDLPTNYDESALFYMASISDQLPATTPQPVVMPAPSRHVVTKESSQASRPQSLAPASGTTSTVQSESTHATRLSSDHQKSASAAPVQAEQVKPEVSAVPRVNPTQDDTINDDALAAYSFLEQPPSPLVRTNEMSAKPVAADRSAVPLTASSAVPVQPGSDTVPQTSVDSTHSARPAAVQYPSTFGQNKRAAERKSAAQLQAQAHQEALSRPGRAGVTKPKGIRRPGWVDDSEEEEDDEEEEDEEDESREDARSISRPLPSAGTVRSAASSNRGGAGTESPVNLADSVGSLGRNNDAASQVAGANFPRSISGYGASLLDGSRATSPGRSPGRGGAPTHPSIQAYQRQSMFNNHLSAAHGDDSRSNTPPQGPIVRDRQTFLQLKPEEQPGAMTTVFTPHGLVQAGAQDKAERSAKAQEAEARAMGSHMVNVPNKPPPPQAGLLGAITAHERDRKGAGGFGATLTERERERVAAERRQREEDALRQQQQQQQMQQMQQMAYFNPMLYQQMMMSGMMGGMGGMGGMGMMGMGMPQMGAFGASQVGAGSQIGGMGGGFDPMMAQQQAMQAAQMAYMSALSQAHQEGSALGHGSMMGHGSPGAAPGSTMGMPMGSMQFMTSPHMSMMGAPFPGFMTQSAAGGIPSEFGGVGGASPSPRPSSTKPNGQGNT
ncbi:uncharacterized protein UMAG_03944 [Mycosarcoma maydis]|uniref:Skg3/CAF120-like PH-like domain-containing protein n=1 Tax=Mycosarcoma maydis TaxID=5270 RepID=A0A0D1CME4_MYCMD|nr:uncharacterized protein UMAG_03944 [Ustilago maydis 521]KIS67888.1 hypothetical protein UMAG_03944 [Ustilago maydis 521]|eukprot:XP_011390413.1 hypothetical protein UMAG_03944 [Ustilago maydis 521]